MEQPGIKQFDCKLICWEYNYEINGSVTGMENGYTPSCIVHPETKVKIGLLIKYELKRFVNDQVELHMVAEKKFVSDNNDVTKWNFQTVEQLIKQSIYEFGEMYTHEYFQTLGLRTSSLKHEIKPGEVKQVLKLLEIPDNYIKQW